jgi:hypothetical protein
MQGTFSDPDRLLQVVVHAFLQPGPGPMLHRCSRAIHSMVSLTPARPRTPASPAEMGITGEDIWGHFAPLFHLVDAFAVYAVTLAGGRHVLLPAFQAPSVLLAIGTQPWSISSLCWGVVCYCRGWWTSAVVKWVDL